MKIANTDIGEKVIKAARSSPSQTNGILVDYATNKTQDSQSSEPNYHGSALMKLSGAAALGIVSLSFFPNSENPVDNLQEAYQNAYEIIVPNRGPPGEDVLPYQIELRNEAADEYAAALEKNRLALKNR